MSHPAGATNERRTRALGGLGLFVAVWLNLAIAPCTMAYDAGGDGDCPHCPPAEAHGGHQMHGHTDGTAAAEMPCAEGLSDCMVDDDANHDGRGGQPKIKDVSSLLFLAPAEFSRGLRPDSGAVLPSRYSMIRPGAPPPIHLLNCVFLD